MDDTQLLILAVSLSVHFVLNKVYSFTSFSVNLFQDKSTFRAKRVQGVWGERPPMNDRALRAAKQKSPLIRAGFFVWRCGRDRKSRKTVHRGFLVHSQYILSKTENKRCPTSGCKASLSGADDTAFDEKITYHSESQIS